MLDTTLDILENDPNYHSFTMDGHSIMIDDYLEIRPERRHQIEKLVKDGRLIIGPYYTLPEEFTISHEALVRNLLWGRKTVEKYGGKIGTVAYTPASWGQTGQMPQILASFGIDKMMFYRGISHHEADAEYIWSAPDGTQVLASRFALYARYNWYYQVHRAVTRGVTFSKDYVWGQYDEVPLRIADTLCGEDQSYDLKRPESNYDKSRLKKAIEDMINTEGSHFTTPVFLAMNGHDISVAYPLESQIIQDAKEIFKEKYEIEHTDLEGFWEETQKYLDKKTMPVLTGERRAYLKTGMWTFLFPGTISARTYLKQQDFNASSALNDYAEPLASLAFSLGLEYPTVYLNRGWKYLLSNHTHDANGGCAPDAVCLDMEYRYRKVNDIAEIVINDSMSHIASNLQPNGLDSKGMQLVVFNPLPFERDFIAKLDLEIPRDFDSKSVTLTSEDDKAVECQPINTEKSSVFVDSIWEVPTIMPSTRIKFYSKLNKLPALGYRTYKILPQNMELRNKNTMVTGHDTMENKYIKVKVNENGTVNITNKVTGKKFKDLNYFIDQGECGNAWKHISPDFDRIYNSKGARALVAVTESGALSSTITAEFCFSVPLDYADGKSRSNIMTDIPIKVSYTLEKDSSYLKVHVRLNNTAKDHWLRVCMPTGLNTQFTYADSHFDVVSRHIPIPDSTGWVEPAGGTHPLRTFVGMSDKKDGLALFSKGLFEYEAFEDDYRTLALTLIRSCRIKLAVSEEKLTELPDNGVQCMGERVFEYAIYVHEGDWRNAGLSNKAAQYYAPARCVMSGRGKGKLPLKGSLFSINNANVVITCVKQAEDGNGLILRMFNPIDHKEDIVLNFGQKITSAILCNMDEREKNTIHIKNNTIPLAIPPKKIITLKVKL
jgi:alpha-mannosidase